MVRGVLNNAYQRSRTGTRFSGICVRDISDEGKFGVAPKSKMKAFRFGVQSNFGTETLDALHPHGPHKNGFSGGRGSAFEWLRYCISRLRKARFI
jgi:hypothetical protein